MSATNRGAERKENDFYPTPKAVIENFLENYELAARGGSALRY